MEKFSSLERAEVRARLRRVAELFALGQEAVVPGTAQGPAGGQRPADQHRDADRLRNAQAGLLNLAPRPAPARLDAVEVLTDAEGALRFTMTAAGRTIAPKPPVLMGDAPARVRTTCEWLADHVEEFPAYAVAMLSERLLPIHATLARLVDPDPEYRRMPSPICPACYRRSLWLVAREPDIFSEVACAAASCRRSWAWTRWSRMYSDSAIEQGA